MNVNKKDELLEKLIKACDTEHDEVKTIRKKSIYMPEESFSSKSISLSNLKLATFKSQNEY